jgi:signal peptidase I
MQQTGAFLFAIVFSLTSYFAVSRYVITAVVVQGRSMAPTLHDGERYFLNRWLFMIREPRRGDLVVIRDAGHHDYAVKRIVGLPNETVSIKEGKVFINNAPMDEPYLFPNTKTICPNGGTMQVRLGEDDYFVLGDNRGNSEDSRYYGALEREQIIGLLVQ